MLKNKNITFFDILSFTFLAVYSIVTLPFYIFFYFFYKIKDVKVRLINDFLTLYKDSSIDVDNYILKINLFDGFSIIHKTSGGSFAVSTTCSAKIVSFSIPYNTLNKYPIKNSHQLKEYFDTKEFVDIFYRDGKKSFIYELHLIEKKLKAENLQLVQQLRFFYDDDAILNGSRLVNMNTTKIDLNRQIFYFDKYLPFDDIVDLMLLHCLSRDPNIVNMFPEINIPSAYNFSDLKERIELAKMIYY